MRETVLANVKKGEQFVFGNVKFEVTFPRSKFDESPEFLVGCVIHGTNSTVYISEAAWVATQS